MTYLLKKNIDKAIGQKLRKKGVYETEMQNIYYLIVGQTNKQIQEEAASESTFKLAKTGRDPIG